MAIEDTSRSSYRATALPMFRRSSLVTMAAGLTWLASGCATKPVTTPVALTATAAPDANPDARGRASPLVVRIYALKAPGAFQGADFFSLYDSETATLGADLIQREQLLLRPGESRTLEWVLAADAKAIGVVAAYRNLELARWRALQTIGSGKPLRLSVVLSADAIRIEAK